MGPVHNRHHDSRGDAEIIRFDNAPGWSPAGIFYQLGSSTAYGTTTPNEAVSVYNVANVTGGLRGTLKIENTGDVARSVQPAGDGILLGAAVDEQDRIISQGPTNAAIAAVAEIEPGGRQDFEVALLPYACGSEGMLRPGRHELIAIIGTPDGAAFAGGRAATAWEQ